MSSASKIISDTLSSVGPIAIMLYVFTRLGMFGHDKIRLEVGDHNAYVSTGVFYNTAYWSNGIPVTIRNTAKSIRPIEFERPYVPLGGRKD